MNLSSYKLCLMLLLIAWPIGQVEQQLAAESADSSAKADSILEKSGDSEDALLFHAAFEDSVEAGKAKGHAAPTESPKSLKYVEGIAGKAISLSDERLAYELKDNLEPAHGSVLLWLQPLGWDPMKNNEYNYFFNACLPGTPNGDKIQFFKLPNPLFYLMLGKEGKVQTMPMEIRSWRKGEWRFFAFTWEDGWMKLYVDGEPAGKSAIAREQLPSQVGDEIYCSIAEATAIDELRIFDKPLAAASVKNYFLLDYLKRKKAEAPSAADDTNPATSMRLKTVVPFVAHPPTNLPEEWNRATEITGFLEIPSLHLTPRQTRVKLAYDANNLYFRFASKIGQKLKADAKEHDGAVYGDDSFEIFIAPSETARKPLYQFVFNSLDAHYESKDGDCSWNGAWQSRSRVSGAEWEAEAIVPFRELDVAAPRPGDCWQFNLGRNWTHPSAFTTITFNLAYSDVTRFARILFGAANAFIKVDQTLEANEKGVKGFLSAPGPETFSAVYAVKKPDKPVLDKGGLSSFEAIPGILAVDETKQIQAGQGDPCAFDFSGKLEAEGQYFSSLRISSPQGEWFNQVTAFEIQRPFAVTLNSLSKDGKLIVAWELNRDIGESFDLSIAFLNSAGKETLARKQKVANARKGELVFDLSSFPEKEYAVQVAAHGSLGSFKQTEKWMSCRNAEWLGFAARQSGKHAVPKPWKPIQIADDEDIKTSQMEYRFSDQPFPQQIVSGGENLLAAPVALAVKADKQELSFQPEKRKWIEKFPDRAAFRQDLISRDLKVETKVTAEFDGMTRFDVVLSPRKKGGVVISGLVLEIPLKPQFAMLKYPYAGHLQKWSVLDLEGEVQGDWKDCFLPHLWVGNDEKGLAWFAETDEHFKLRDETRAVEIARRSGRIVMRITMVDHPVTVTEPLGYTFGLMATPSRPLAENWSSMRFASCTSTTSRPMVSTGYTTGPEYHAKPGVPYPASDPDRFIKSLSKDSNIKNLVYVTSNGAGDNIPEYRYYHQEWKNPAIRDTWTYASRGFFHDGICPASPSWRDFFLSSTAKAIDEYGIDGFYYDYGTVMPDTNPVYCGYTRDGKQFPTYPIFADRELRKQIYMLFQEKGKAPWFVLHNYSKMMAPLASFCQMVLDGESYQQRLGGVGQKVANDYTQLLTLPRLRAMLGVQFGTAPVFLPEFAAEDRDNPKLTRTLIAWMSPLGIQPWGFNCHIAELNQFCAAQDRFGFSASEFFPCWKHRGVFMSREKEMPYISFWKKKNSALVAFSNLSGTPFEGGMRVNAESLWGRKANHVTAADGCSGEAIPVKDGTIQLRVDARDYRLVVLKMPE
ncbi:MAG: hypothetical protein HY360_22300 [Verrucomicrobia bacterium]|nr:hypothetical protein [Verrucomicrobiota bacterium]